MGIFKYLFKLKEKFFNSSSKGETVEPVEAKELVLPIGEGETFYYGNFLSSTLTEASSIFLNNSKVIGFAPKIISNKDGLLNFSCVPHYEIYKQNPTNISLVRDAVSKKFMEAIRNCRPIHTEEAPEAYIVISTIDRSLIHRGYSNVRINKGGYLKINDKMSIILENNLPILIFYHDGKYHKVVFFHPILYFAYDLALFNMLSTGDKNIRCNFTAPGNHIKKIKKNLSLKSINPEAK